MAKAAIRPIRIEGNIAFVPLTQGYEAVIDAADVPLIEGVAWSVIRSPAGHVYARRSRLAAGAGGAILMHRVLMGNPAGLEIDHADGETLNNRRGNLRAASKSQNQHNARTSRANKSGAKGVFARNGKWSAQIRVDKKLCHLGRFSTLGEAANAYAEASARLHGAFGRVA